MYLSDNYKDQINAPGNELACLTGGGDKICDIQTNTIKDVLDSMNIVNPYIKFIKIDTEGHELNVLKGIDKYLHNTNYIIFECSDCLDDFRGPNIINPMKTIIDYLETYDFDVYRIGTKKLLKVNGNYWDNTYEKIKFHSNCFAIKHTDSFIHSIIDDNFNYI
jgi:hypothetical protein